MMVQEDCEAQAASLSTASLSRQKLFDHPVRFHWHPFPAGGLSLALEPLFSCAPVSYQQSHVGHQQHERSRHTHRHHSGEVCLNSNISFQIYCRTSHRLEFVSDLARSP